MDYDIKTVNAKANAGMATGITALGIEAASLLSQNGGLGNLLGELGPILNFQVQGGVTFHQTDLEKLLDYIKEA